MLMARLSRRPRLRAAVSAGVVGLTAAVAAGLVLTGPDARAAAGAAAATTSATATTSASATSSATATTSPPVTVPSVPVASSTAAPLPVPAVDPFYAAPANLASMTNGSIVRWRPVDAAVAFAVATVPTQSWQVAYRTLDAMNLPIVNVTTILVPQVAYAGTAKTRPVISYQTAEDSTGSQCSPSYSLRTGSNLLTSVEQSVMAVGLLQGFTLAIPDHEGPNSAFLAGPQSAHLILDGVRAALQFTPAGITPTTPVGLWGYSGGGHATAWAAEQAATYAPDLHIAGAAFGGAPVNLTNTLNTLDRGPFTSFVWDAVVGLHNAYPAFAIQGYLNPAGQAAFAAASNACIADFGVTDAFTTFDNDSTVPNVVGTPLVQTMIKKIALGQARPDMPVLDYYSLLDEAVPPADSQSLISRYCGQGVRVQGDGQLLSEHVTLALFEAPTVLSFLSARFNGTPLTTYCLGTPQQHL